MTIPLQLPCDTGSGLTSPDRLRSRRQDTAEESTEPHHRFPPFFPLSKEAAAGDLDGLHRDAQLSGLPSSPNALFGEQRSIKSLHYLASLPIYLHSPPLLSFCRQDFCRGAK